MKEEADKTEYIKLKEAIKIRDVFGELKHNKIKELDNIFEGFVSRLKSTHDFLSWVYFLEKYSIRLDIEEGKGNHYLFHFTGEGANYYIHHYFLLNAEFYRGCFYIYGYREVYPAIDHETGVLSFSAKNLEEINKKRRSLP